MVRHIIAAFGALLVLLVLASAAEAQTLRGRVIDAATGAPVVGSIVKANGPGGELGAGTLTGADGAFTLTVPSGFDLGSLSVERIGYATQTFAAGTIGGPEDIELRVDSAPVEIGGVLVTTQRLCRVDPNDAGLVQSAWDEARKSLEITELSRAQRAVRYRTESYQRDLDPSSTSVLRGSSDRRLMTSDIPYRSISVERMTEAGWIEGNPYSGMVFYAPDAAILLTDEFAEQHCFEAEATANALLLHFEPNRARRSYPELEGTLVLDRATLELTELRFDYVGVPGLRRAGGEIGFFAAPNGLRVVRDWAIRGPVMSRVRRRAGSLASDDLRIDYIREEGGRVLAVESNQLSIEVTAEPLDLGRPEPGRNPEATESQVATSRLLGGSAGAELLLRNDDSMPYRVTQVELADCVNIAVECGEYPVDVTVEPGETGVVFRVRKQRVLDPFGFTWNYAGETVEPVEVAGSDTIAEASALISTAIPEAAAERYRSSRVVSMEEIPVGYENALELVEAIRPQWLTKRAVGTTVLPGQYPAEIRVYVDDLNMTPSPGDGAEVGLRVVPVENIETIEFVDGPTATIRWGTNHQLGAIVITTRR